MRGSLGNTKLKGYERGLGEVKCLFFKRLLGKKCVKLCTTNGKTKRKKKKRDYMEFIYLYCDFDIQQITVHLGK